MTNHRQQLAVEAFTAAIERKSQNKRQLEAGLLIRKGFQQQLARKIVPEHPRFEWVRRHARFLLELLLKTPADYQADPPDSDRISMADLLDVAAMTTNHINEIIGLGFMDPAKVELLPFKEVKGIFQPKPDTEPIEVPEPEEEDEEEESEESPDLELLAALDAKK